MYLNKFTLPIDEESSLIEQRMAHNGGSFGYIDNAYPCGIFSKSQFSELNFSKITILYGGNGSGKSTLLNLISNKLELNRIAPYNSSEMFDLYVEHCKFELGIDDEGFKHRIPNGSRIITSDDIFDYMLTVRTNNDEISDSVEDIRSEWGDKNGSLKYGQTVKMNSLDDYEALRLQVLSRKKSISRREFIRRVAGTEVKLNSNGETALSYFNSKLKNDTLYCLDEPENSLSPRMQLELVKMIEQMARYCGCQFIIATHSPFLLAMEFTKIYDLDTNPVDIKQWWELENAKVYFDFFNKHKRLFLVDK
ncbi:AAA family ATPase [Paenibacillus arenosi]|uniref:AAA family ATPase n=1 Tax=Paenibacillus arenosi TaxID=2774142 RepID=A0ABR9B3D2_9BACL|nr:AAA family ATPase [Paenibacillus arenosi]MBD8500419.1 AAA family ATPase [Paenibacillus arenosi]